MRADVAGFCLVWASRNSDASTSVWFKRGWSWNFGSLEDWKRRDGKDERDGSLRVAFEDIPLLNGAKSDLNAVYLQICRAYGAGCGHRMCVREKEEIRMLPMRRWPD